jgi:hypothetical protein
MFEFLLTLAILAGGLWLAPVGPALVGVYWVPFLFVASFIALFRAAAPRPPRRKRRRNAQSSVLSMQDDMPMAPVGLGILFWLLLTGLAIVALIRYAMSGGSVI